MSHHPHIVIIGGGFAGLYTALRLLQFPWEASHRPDITLIDRQDHFVFSPLLYELITEEMQPWEVAPTYAELLRHGPVKFLQTQVQTINPAEKQVICGDRQIAYDYLVIAAGGTTKILDIPGVKEHAIPFKTLNDALRLKEKLRALETSEAEKIRVAIVGGGYSGVELACKLADRLGDRGRLRIIDRGETILKNAPKFNQEAAQKALEERGIWIDYETEVTELTADSLSLRYKGEVDTIPVELVLWTGGTAIAPWIRELTLPHADNGKLQVNSQLQISDQPEIFALGDVAQGTDDLPMTAQVAIQQADVCAWNLRGLIANKPLLPFNFFNLGEMLTLGEDNATLSGLGIELEGNLAHLARRLVYLYRLPTWEHQVQVGLNWLVQPLAKLLAQSAK
ncbi:type II NADH dehydrogenase B [[Synechococcus] sp. NIES-970]|uniref:NAD(P)/FAD-dependent oxidoreductase n=1 Tax=Picosynechococcus sp. NKBG15041c TaxID=1407650 RepID=UPI000465666D|nr:NAD(P)/FAD-dependent oxidoreductase [Picosynechococcus sp. NKBG15041c]BAW96632.1 type II NADH dehydrogenase B [[Synechococcus] sp. NIES-970]